MYKKLLIIFLLGSLASCGGKKEDNSNGDKAKELEKLKKERTEIQAKIAALESQLGAGNNAALNLVAVASPSKGEFQHYLEVQGRVESDQNVAVTAKTPGVITEVRVQRGDDVVKGQLLLQLDDGVLRTTVAEIKNSLDLATTIFQKQKKLWDQQIGTEIQYLSAKNNKESLEKRLATINEQLEMYRIKSPINGQVDEVMPKVGEMAAPGMPMVRVVNYEKSKVTADVSEVYASRINKGDKVIVFFPDQEREMQSSIRVVSRAINTTNRTFTIEVPISNSEIQIRPNMVAVVRVNDYTNAKALTVPSNIIQQDENATYIYIAEPQGKKFVVKKKIVKQGQTYNGVTEILSGLDGSEKVVTTGYQNITEGQEIAVTEK